MKSILFDFTIDIESLLIRAVRKLPRPIVLASEQVAASSSTALMGSSDLVEAEEKKQSIEIWLHYLKVRRNPSLFFHLPDAPVLENTVFGQIFTFISPVCSLNILSI